MINSRRSSNEVLSLQSLIAANLVAKKAKGKTVVVTRERERDPGRFYLVVNLKYFHVKPSVVVGVDFKTKTFIRILG